LIGLTTRYIFLFDKIILMSKSTRGECYSYKESLKISDYKVQELAPVDGGGASGAASGASQSSSDVVRAAGRRVMRRDSSRWTHAFLLVHVKESNAYTVFARTADDKSKWMEVLREAYATVNLSEELSSSHDFHMTTFEKPVSCSVCFKFLKGLFFQGYRLVMGSNKCLKIYQITNNF
jgi:guanine nucleotide exchange factor VAV